MSVVALGNVAIKAPGRPVAFQLARREGRRLIRHPVFIVGGLLSLAMFGLMTWQAAPVLHRDDTNVAGALLPLAAATLMVTNLAASRATRNGTDELYDGTATSSALRTAGHLLSLTFAVGAAAGLVCVMFAYMLLDAPAGTPRSAEILTGPVAVALLGGVGIALGRWKPHPALGPIAVVALIALEMLLIQPVIGLEGTNGGVASRVPWLAPWVPLSLTGEVPPELVIRPAGWHLLYLAGLGVLFAVLALGRQGFPRPVAALFAAGAAGTVVGAVGQLSPPGSAQRAAIAALVEEPEQHQVCEHGVASPTVPIPRTSPGSTDGRNRSRVPSSGSRRMRGPKEWWCARRSDRTSRALSTSRRRRWARSSGPTGAVCAPGDPTRSGHERIGVEGRPKASTRSVSP